MRPSRSPSGSTPDPHHFAGGHQRVEHRPAGSRAMRAGRISRSSTDAGIAAPCSCSIASSSASSPRRLRPDAVPRRSRTGRARRCRPARSPAAARPATGGGGCAAHRRSTHSRSVPPGRNSPSMQPAGARQPQQQRLRRPPTPSPKRAASSRGGERAVRPRVAQHEIADRVADRLEQRLGQALRQRHAERVAVARGVLDGDVAAPRRRSARATTRRAAFQRCRTAAATSGDRGCAPAISVDGQIADAQQQIVDAVDGRDAVPLGSRCCSCRSTLVDAPRIEQLAQLGVAEQLAQLRLIDRQRLRPPLGQRRVAVVDVVGDVAEEQRRGERRRRRRVDRSTTRSARADRPAQRLDQRRHVEVIAQALRDRSRAAIGNEPNRDATASRSAARLRCCQSGVRAPGPSPRQQQRPRGGLAEARREQRRRAELPQRPAPSTSSGSGSSSAGSGGCVDSGKRTTNPSSPHIASTSMPRALAHAAR